MVWSFDGRVSKATAHGSCMREGCTSHGLAYACWLLPLQVSAAACGGVCGAEPAAPLDSNAAGGGCRSQGECCALGLLAIVEVWSLGPHT
jgi:hypothetical protein